MRPRHPVLLFLLWTLALPLPATLVERLSLEDLAGRSERIVHGRCGRVWSAWDESRQAIWTHCEVAVLDPLKGGATATLTVSEPGGVVDGVEMWIEGVPRLEPGEEAVLFLYRTPNGLWRARGLGQGRFRVLRDRRSGRAFMRADLAGAALVEPLRPPAGPATDLRRLDGISLEDFKASVRAAVARGRASSDTTR